MLIGKVEEFSDWIFGVNILLGKIFVENICKWQAVENSKPARIPQC